MVDSRRGRSGLLLNRLGFVGAMERIVRIVELVRENRGRRKDGGGQVRAGSRGGISAVAVDCALVYSTMLSALDREIWVT